MSWWSYIGLRSTLALNALSFRDGLQGPNTDIGPVVGHVGPEQRSCGSNKDNTAAEADRHSLAGVHRQTHLYSSDCQLQGCPRGVDVTT